MENGDGVVSLYSPGGSSVSLGFHSLSLSEGVPPIQALSGIYAGKQRVSLEVVLQDLLKELRRVEEGVVENRVKMQELSEVLATATQGVGVVRFNAFQNTGSDLSFAVALLDAHRNGVVISSIYGREESRTYAKPVSGGKSAYQLGEEEQEAMNRALKSMRLPAGQA
jgi:hypothetical protein